MHEELKRYSLGLGSGIVCRYLSLVILALVLLLTAQSSRADIDMAINRTVWAMTYGVTDAQLNSPAWLAADDDGDGVSNGAELAAGTNPFSRTSSFVVTAATIDPSHNVSLAFATVPGKLYVVQSTGSLSSAASWTNMNPSVQFVGDGTSKTLTAPAASGTAPAFYRVVVQDIDTDGDGVSDWAERAVGFDPTTAHTRGSVDDDHTALVNDLVKENSITIVATKSSATQPPDAVTAATDVGTITITRGGNLHFSAITVPLTWAGTAVAGTDYAQMPASVTFPAKTGVVTLTVIPLVNSARRVAATVTAVARAGGGYTLATPSAASVAVAPASNATGTGLSGNYYVADNKVGTYTAAIFDPTKLTVSRFDSTVDFIWASSANTMGSPDPKLNYLYYAVRWTGQVQPQYSETYYFDTVTDDGVKLWVNGQLIIDGWANNSAERVAAINLQAGVLYDIRMEYYQYNVYSQAHLYWYSNSQPKQIIPATRLYPASVTAAPPAITSAVSATGFVSQPFSFAVTASNSGGTAPTFALGSNSTLPPGLTLNATTGVISGTPTQAGDFQVALLATNTLGTGAGVLDINILAAGNGVTREIWKTGVTGTTVADVPTQSAPTTKDNLLGSPEDNTAYPARTGVRLRGYFTAPNAANYYFWLAANNNAELWISDDAEGVNSTRRAWVTAPGTSSRGWTTSGQTHQRSPWLALDAGQRYYYEILYNTGDSGTSNVALGWLQDAAGTATTPVVAGSTGVAPGYLLGQYDYPPTVAAAGTLYATNLSPQGASVSTAVGSANLRLNPDKTQAILHFNYSGLSTPRTAYHIHVGADAAAAGPIVFDLDDVDRFHPELKTSDGGYVWNIIAVGNLMPADIVNALQQGFAYFNVHTVSFPNGEIRGNLGLVQGSQNPPVAVADPGYTNDSATEAAAARFLNQAAFGASPTDLAGVKSLGYSAWIDNQMTLAKTHLFDDVQAHLNLDPRFPYTSTQLDNAWWRAAVQAPDQLRQRVAFALSEIMVISSANSTLTNRADGMSTFYDTLADNAFGNFRDLLKAVTLHPAMGFYLNMQGNAKGSFSSGLHPNENYGREIMQLFSIGLNRLWPDGTLVLDSQGNLVPTYDQDVITGMARVFTGWTWYQAPPTDGTQLKSFGPAQNWVLPMSLVPGYHELGTKKLLDNVMLPPAVGYNFPAAATTGSQADPNNALCTAYGNADLDAALDAIYNHPNTGPYICRQLIQRLVSSNPSPDYLYRVVRKFNDDGSAQHVRGNMTAVIKAILLDGEARSLAVASATSSGKQREPLLRIVSPARAFPYNAYTGTYSQTGGSPVITVTLPSGSTNRLASGDGVALDFSSNAIGTAPNSPYYSPMTGNYKLLATPAPTANSYAVTSLGVTSATYTAKAQATTPVTYLTTINTAGPAVVTNTDGSKTYGEVYVQYVPAGANPDGKYTVTDPSGTNLQLVSSSSPSTATGTTVVVNKTAGSYVITNPTGATVSTMTVVAYANHNLKQGDTLWMDVGAGSTTMVTSKEWTVDTVIDPFTFTVLNSVKYAKVETNVSITLYPLVPPLPARSGNVSQPASKFDMGSTNGSLAQTPLNSPTVFNFFYPDYKFPGTLSAYNVTTPEFELTTDTNIITMTNTINTTILSSTTNNNGLSSFNGGSIMLDLSPYMAAPYSVADAAGVGTLVDKMSALLTGGQVTTQTKNEIIQYVTGSTIVSGKSTPNFVSTSSTNVRDRVRAVVQLILISPEYAVQR